LNAIRVRGLRQPDTGFRVDPEMLCRLPEALRAEQEVFSRTGGLHAAALFDGEGRLMALREDIGRHNAVDKIAGWALLEKRLPLSQHVMLVSGQGRIRDCAEGAGGWDSDSGIGFRAVEPCGEAGAGVGIDAGWFFARAAVCGLFRRISLRGCTGPGGSAPDSGCGKRRFLC
jgi:hypothetical protein